MEAPRYRAKEIEDGLYSGMDPDVELVAAQYYDQMKAERDELQRRLDVVVGKVNETVPLEDECSCILPLTILAIAEGRDNG